MSLITPKTLIIDIETAPVKAAVWGLWKQNIGLDMIDSDWFILSFSAKWLDKKEIIYKDQRDKKDIEDDADLLKEIWALFNEADFVVAHNGRKFDIPKINTRFVLNGMRPPSPYKIIDTLDIAKKHFAMTSNKLEYLSNLLSKKPKLKHGKFPGYKLWKECMNNNIKAWQEMEKYNIRDTEALQDVYLKLRAWNSIQPNAGVFADSEIPLCSKCGSRHVRKEGFRFTGVSKYQRWSCKDCGGWSRSRLTVNTKEVRKSLLVGA